MSNISKKLVNAIEMAKHVASFSLDPWKKVGCVGLSTRGTILATGKNHAGAISASSQFWKDREARRPFMIHSELDMLYNLHHTGKIHELYSVVITLFPCVHCMTALAAHKVCELYFLEIYDKDKPAIAVAEFYGIQLNQIREH